MKFVRTPEYEQKLFEQALFDDKKVIKDAKIEIIYMGNKLKAWCEAINVYLQFPRNIRTPHAIFTADIVEVQNATVDQKYYRVMKGSIRKEGSDQVVA